MVQVLCLLKGDKPCRLIPCNHTCHLAFARAPIRSTVHQLKPTLPAPPGQDMPHSGEQVEGCRVCLLVARPRHIHVHLQAQLQACLSAFTDGCSAWGWDSRAVTSQPPLAVARGKHVQGCKQLLHTLCLGVDAHSSLAMPVGVCSAR